MVMHKSNTTSVKIPRSYQLEAIKKAIQHYIKDQNKNGILKMACATGKTLTSLWIAEKLRAKKIVILVPNINLLSQILDDWCEQSMDAGLPYNFLCLCSDQTVSKQEFDTHLDIDVTTNAHQLALFMASNEFGVVVTTYHSCHLLREAKAEFDLGIFDEAHFTAGNDDKFAAECLDYKGIDRKMFVTATPRVVKVNDDADADIEFNSMDDENVYGKIFYELSTAEAEKKGIILPYIVYYTYHPKVAELRRKMLRYIEKHNITFRDFVLAASTVMDMVEGTKGIKKVVVYHRSIDSAISFGNLCKEISDTFFDGFLDTYHVNSNHKQSEKKEIIKNFAQSEFAIITNVNILSTGWNLPQLDTVVFANPDRSTVSIIQKIGRVQRRYKGATNANIILPVFSEEGETAFDEIKYILAALCDDNATIKNEVEISAKRPENALDVPVEALSVVSRQPTLFEQQQHQDNLQTAYDLMNDSDGIELGELEKVTAQIEQFEKKYNTNEITGNRIVLPEKQGIEHEMVLSDFEKEVRKAGLRVLGIRGKWFLPVEEALEILRAWLKKHGITTERQFRTIIKTATDYPDNVPKAPMSYYKITWNEVIGRDEIKWLPKKQALRLLRAWLKKHGITTFAQFKALVKTATDYPDNVPKAPRLYYKITWKEIVGENWLPKKQALRLLRAWLKKHGITTLKQFKTLVKTATDYPDNVPKAPRKYYKINWSEIMGKERHQIGGWLPKKQALRLLRAWLKKYRITTFAQFKALLKTATDYPNNVPKAPMQYYKITWNEIKGIEKRSSK